MERPDATALLEEARRTLLEVLLPLLPADRRYDALMVANAMAIAGRETGQAEEATRGLLKDLTLLTGEAADAGLSKGEIVERFAALERRLAGQIRSGRYDAPEPRREAVRRYLRSTTIARLRISNPKVVTE